MVWCIFFHKTLVYSLIGVAHGFKVKKKDADASFVMLYFKVLEKFTFELLKF